MDIGWFHKRFSVGLVLDTTVEEFRDFLEQYHPYIANIYFSLPMGERFHARRRVAQQLSDQQTVALFWELLQLIRSYDIDLEVVFNTGGLTPRDVFSGSALLAEHGVQVQLVGLVEPLYEAVQQAFPDAGKVFSFNNRGNGISALRKVTNAYDEFVVGRQDIRNRALMEAIHREKHARTVLLVNNGCSFICGGCTVLQNCHEAYYREARHKSAPMLYAMQSIFPFEIHERLLDPAQIDLIKLSTRNSDIRYVRRCLESYLYGDEARWIRESPDNYYLWGRLAWHSEFYEHFQLEELIRWKRQWYETGVWEKTPPLAGPSAVDLDLRRRKTPLTADMLPGWSHWIDRLASGFPWKPGVCYLEPRDPYLRENMQLLRQSGWQVWLVLPAGFGGSPLPAEPDGLVVNDATTAREMAGRGYPVALGWELAALAQPQPPNTYDQGNAAGYGSGLLDPRLRQLYQQLGAAFAVVAMPPQGIQISHGEPVTLKAHVLSRPDSRDPGQLLPAPISPGIRKTLAENRMTPILCPPER